MPEMIAVVDRIAEDPGFRSDFYLVFDIREAEYTAEIDDGDAFVAVLQRRGDYFRNRIALVVPEALHVLAKLFCLLAHAKGIERMQCFTDIGKAREWCVETPR